MDRSQGNVMEKIVFLNIGWMKNYKGFSGDKITGGGSFVAQKGYGHEIYNFLQEKGKIFGYVQPVIPHNTIKIERIGAEPKDNFINNVLTVWVSKSPSGGVYIIGWYKNATIFRNIQKPSSKTNRKYKGEIFGYYVIAKQSNCTLLPLDNRTFQIPRGKGGMGQSNVWYADDEDHVVFKNSVFAYIKNGKSPNLSKKSSKNGTPRQPDPIKKQKVEESAIKETIKHYEQLGYTVNSVEKDNIGWDLEATFGKKKILIEVKGLSQSQIVVELTPNEYKNMKRHKDIYRVAVLTDALKSNRELHIFSYSPENKQWEDEKGRALDVEERVSARMSV
jgi:hypothetical protein